MGTWPAFKAASFCSSLSTRITSWPRSAKHPPATSPTYPDPTTAIFIQQPFRRLKRYFISFHSHRCTRDGNLRSDIPYVMCNLGKRWREFLEPTSGLEPLTCRLRIGCSTRLSYVGLTLILNALAARVKIANP